MARAGAAALLLGGLAGCAAAPTPTQSEDASPGGASASLAVDVYGGLDVPGAAPEQERVELVMDLTRSMLLPAPGGATRLARARHAAAELLASLEAGADVSLRGVGHRAASGCAASERLAEHLARGDAAALDARLRAAQPQAEASLAQTLDEVGRDLEREAAARATRVVVLSDLDDSCGGDLCAAAARLVERGAWLQLVPTGAAAAPACLAELLPSPALPRASASADAPFTVTSADTDRALEILAVGRAGDGFVPVPPGVVSLLVHLEPPERIGPFRLDPGDAARVRILDDRSAGRTWRLERGEEAVGRAFPPPDTLPESAR
jgi:hypothetical protein